MKHIDLFSGIGGFALAVDRVWEDVEHIFCDNEIFSQEIIKKHWPNSKIYGDIRTLTSDAESQRVRGMAVEREQNKKTTDIVLDYQRGPFILTGGFPCQPFSQAGRRRGTEDNRHLWPEMLRVIREFHPRWIIGENVSGLVTWSEGLVLEQIHTDLESAGYEVQAFIIPAVAVNAPHRRDRVWIIAHNTASGNASDADSGRVRRYECQGIEKGTVACSRSEWDKNWIEVATELCRVDDGIPKRLDRASRLKGLGNAIVPQVAEEIMRFIKKVDEKK